MQRVTRGLTALVLMVLLVVGLPALLWALRGNPLPHTWSPTAAQHALSTPDTGHLTVQILTWVAWIAWATFALPVLLELPAQARGIRAPHLPGLRLQQRGAHILVAAVLAMLSVGGVAMTQAAPASAATTTARITTTVSTGTHAGRTANTTTLAATKSHTTKAPAAKDKIVTVRAGDSLWEIAKNTTGAGDNWKPIFNASRHTTQPDGHHLTDPDDILIGWNITVPGHLLTHPAAPAPAPSQHTPARRTAPAAPHHNAPPRGATPAQAQPPANTTPQTTAPSRVVSPATGRAGGTGVGGATPSQDAAHPTLSNNNQRNEILTLTGLGALAAAGVLVLLGRRRNAQSRKRRPGRRIAMPTGPTAQTELELRDDADPLAAADLDLAMRTLAAVTAATGQDLPDLRAARITPTALELYLVDADVTLPTPFTELDGGIWTISREGIPELLDEQDAEQIPAPYPCLVTLGQDEDHAWVLLNVETTHALTLTSKDNTHNHDVLTAMTLELIGSSWADDLRITLVDVMPDLADALGSDRVSHITDLDHLLQSLEYTATVHTTALTDEGLASAGQARAAGKVPDTWTPHLVIMATEPTTQQRERLTELLNITPRLAVAALTTSTQPFGDWVLDVDDLGDAVLSPIDMHLLPQHMDAGTYTQLVDAFRTTEAADVPGPVWALDMDDEPALADLPDPVADTPQTETLDATDAVTATTTTRPDQEPTEPDVDLELGDDLTELLEGHTAITPTVSGQAAESAPTSAGDEILTETARHDATHTPIATPVPTPPGPRIQLLGDVTIDGAQGKRPDAPGRATELIAYLALQPCTTHEPLDAAMWPGQRVVATKRNGPISQARSWLGTATDGHPYVALVDELGYRLADDTTVDWHQLRDLVGESINSTSTDSLKTALHMVKGQPLTVKTRRGAWAWAEVDRQEMIATIADLAHELANRALRSGDARTAAWAAAKGVMVEPASEMLWRDSLRAAYLSANPSRVETIATQLTDTLEPIAGELEPETLDLLHELLEGPRRAVS